MVNSSSASDSESSPYSDSDKVGTSTSLAMSNFSWSKFANCSKVFIKVSVRKLGKPRAAFGQRRLLGEEGDIRRRHAARKLRQQAAHLMAVVVDRNHVVAVVEDDEFLVTLRQVIEQALHA